jgi:hypothetical protein
MKLPSLSLYAAAGAALVSPAQAQWLSTSYTLKSGSNAICLRGDATWLTPDQHFAAFPNVEEVWRWNPNPSQVQFTTSPSQPTPGTPEWSVWRRGQPQNSDLALMTGQPGISLEHTMEDRHSCLHPPRGRAGRPEPLRRQRKGHPALPARRELTGT